MLKLKQVSLVLSVTLLSSIESIGRLGRLGVPGVDLPKLWNSVKRVCPISFEIA